MKVPQISHMITVFALTVCFTAISAQSQGMQSQSGMAGQGAMAGQGGMAGQGDMAGQGTPMTGTTPANSAGVMDADSMVREGFLRDVSTNGQMETELSRLALTQSSNQSVKSLAQQVIQDHQKFADDLASAAKEHDTAVPNGLPGHFRKNEKKLQSLSGSAFDQAYLKQLSHDVKSDQKESKQVAHTMDTPVLQHFAMTVETSAENRLHQIDELAKSENVPLK